MEHEKYNVGQCKSLMTMLQDQSTLGFQDESSIKEIKQFEQEEE